MATAGTPGPRRNGNDADGFWPADPATVEPWVQKYDDIERPKVDGGGRVGSNSMTKAVRFMSCACALSMAAAVSGSDAAFKARVREGPKMRLAAAAHFGGKGTECFAGLVCRAGAGSDRVWELVGSAVPDRKLGQPMFRHAWAKCLCGQLNGSNTSNTVAM